MKQRATIEEALEVLRRGGTIIIVDDESREGEGDFVAAAGQIRETTVNLMISRGRGLLCAAMGQASAERLELRVQPGAIHDTAFTESVNYLYGITTGISSHDRTVSLQKLTDPASQATDFARPGHLFPLVARPGGVLERRGHTEAAVDLCRLAGLPEVAAICEIMNTDGSMARGGQIEELATELDMPLLTVEDIVQWRKTNERLIEPLSQAVIPTEFGDFSLHTIGYRPNSGRSNNDRGPLVLASGLVPQPAGDRWPADVAVDHPPLVRVHSECATGDIFGSLRCDCGPQLRSAMEIIAGEQRGLVIYLRQEGRGIGLVEKLRAYQLQDQGMDTHDANIALGHPADAREYWEAAEILKLFGLHEVRLLTNNPEKVRALSGLGIRVAERVALTVEANSHNHQYLEAKRLRFGHHIAERKNL